MRSGRVSPLAVLVLAPAAALWLGCGGGSADITAPPTGVLEVTTATSGPEPDSDGYTVSIDGAAPVAIGANATRRTEGVGAGEHTVALSGVAANCAVSGGATLSVEVGADAVGRASFAVTCTPTTGTIAVTTASTGSPADPDGYELLLDGTLAQAIGTTATATLPGVAPGGHTVGLGGVAAGCTVEGDNPREVNVVAGATATVAIAVSCAPPPPPGPGGIGVTTRTTGPDQDADGYAVTLDGGNGLPIGANATVALVDVAPGPHAVGLSGISPNCTLAGDNPRTVTVATGTAAEVTFAITCTATTGDLAVTVTGLPAGADAAVTVTGPGGFSEAMTATRTLTGLVPGSYSVTAADVASGGTTYTANPASRNVTVAAAATAEARVAYGPVATPTLNLRIDSWYLSQSVQSPEGDVPMVDNRDGYLRVFVVANQANTATPAVRVRVYRDGTLVRTLTIPAPSGSTPTSRNEDDLARSWNLKLPRELIGDGFRIVADVDPSNAIAEADETDNSHPVSGTPLAPSLRQVPLLAVRFVPVRQQTSGLVGDVTAGNRAGYFDLTRRMYPVALTDGDVHAVYTTGTSDPLQPTNGNGAWVTVLSEIDALRVAEGTGRNYYGVVRLDYGAGIAGIGFLGTPTAMGYDHPTDRGRVMAHELGHNWNRLHSPCGQPGDVDPNYPYANGAIGVFGVDMRDEVLKPPVLPDIMGYCGSPWVSDYTYQAALTYLAAAQAAEARAAAAAPQRCLLVWGRIVNGQPVLEPAFEVVTRPSLPAAAGPYAVEGLAADGGRLFALSFDAAPVADVPGGSDARHFAFAVPLDERRAVRLGSLRLATPWGTAATARAPAPPAAARLADAVEARAAGPGVALRWDAAAHPMVMVRDPDTGEVLSFARGGTADIVTDKPVVDLIMSDGVGSRGVRVPVGR